MKLTQHIHKYEIIKNVNKIHYLALNQTKITKMHQNHIQSKSKGGSNDIRNLIPLNWKNNLDTGDNYKVTCTIKSSGSENIGF